MYIALICRAENLGIGCKHPASLTGTSKTKLVKHAIKVRVGMEEQSGNTYEIYVGKLTEMVDLPVQFSLKKI